MKTLNNFWLNKAKVTELREDAQNHLIAHRARKQHFVFDNSLIILNQCVELIDLIIESENEMLLAEDI